MNIIVQPFVHGNFGSINPNDIFYIIKKKMEEGNYPINVELKCLKQERKTILSQLKRIKYLSDQSDIELKKLNDENKKLKNICFRNFEKIKKTFNT